VRTLSTKFMTTAALLLAAACGGSGTVSIKLTDAPGDFLHAFVTITEVDLVGSKLAANRNARRLLPPQFRRVESKPVSYNFTLTRYRAPHPVRVPFRVLDRGALVGGGRYSSVLTWPSPSASGGTAAGR